MDMRVAYSSNNQFIDDLLEIKEVVWLVSQGT